MHQFTVNGSAIRPRSFPRTGGLPTGKAAPRLQNVLPQSRPDAIDIRLVLRSYAATVAGAGLFIYLWPLRGTPEPVARWLAAEGALSGVPWGRFAAVRIGAAVLTAFGLCALALATIDEPRSRRRALTYFALVHIVGGLMVWLQWWAVLSPFVPVGPALAPLLVGLLLLYFALTQEGADPRRPFQTLISVLDETPAPAADRLRSEYEEQIARAARQEERGRLARDLHDAVKQQLFVIQTAAATAQARLGVDPAGTMTALDQIRASSREATTEMEAMLQQLQSPPLASTGLLDALRRQTEALRFRTGAEVSFVSDPLPPDWALPPGTPEALFRVAQEALANVGRHARASTVQVKLGAVGGLLTLSVRDNGSGFDPDTAVRGIGSASMRRRAEAIGGAFELWSRPGGGTTITVTVPYETATPGDFRTLALRWGAVAAVSFALLFTDHDGPTWAVHVIITTAMVVTSVRYATGWLRLRRRAGDGA
jgi:signal transduction histidine kinase